MTETDTDAGPTRFPTAPWRATNETAEDRSVAGGAAVWDTKGDFVCALDSELAGDGTIEKAFDRARLIAAAGSAAHELPDEYDPVAAQGVLPEMVDILECEKKIFEGKHERPEDFVIYNRICDTLQRARGDDASQ